MIVRVEFIHEERNQDGFQELGIDPEIIEYLEEGLIDMRHVVAIGAYHEHTQIYMIGGQTLIIDEDFENFAAKWKKTR